MFDVEEFVEITTDEGAFRFDGTIHMRDARNLLIACPAEAGPHILEGRRVQLAQLIDDSLYQIETTILRCQQNYFVVGMIPPQLVQRRRKPRHACSLSVTYVIQSFPPRHLRETVKKKKGIIQDISMGGMKLVMNESVPTGTLLVVELALDKSGAITLPAEALRCKPVEASSPEAEQEYQISCRFTDVPRIHQIQLHRYLTQQGAS